MRFRKIYIAFLCFGGVLCSTNSLAQQTDTLFSDVSYVIQRDAWLLSKNPSGLKYFSLPKISTAQLFINRSDGEFRNYHQSTNSRDYGIQAESFQRLNTAVVFYGSVLYTGFNGKNMAGSGFIDPYKTPIDIVERYDVNRGTKKQELYRLTGKVAAQLNSKFAIGGGLEYEASNFAKMKDLRHINKLLDLDASFGGLYQLSNVVELGLNYNYLRRIESVGFRSYGNKEEGFDSIISFGAFYGKPETFGRYGYTSSDNTRPLTDIGHAINLQLNLHFNNKVKLLNEFSYAAKQGYFGEKATSMKPFTEHQKDDIEYRATLSVIGAKNEHYLVLKTNLESLTNLENNAVEQTTPGGVDRILFYLQNDVLDRQLLKASLQYTFFKDVVNNNPNWMFNTEVNFFRRQQTVNYIYPFYREQTINSYKINANLQRNIVKTDRIYSFVVGLGYGRGGGTAKYDGFHVTPSSNQVAAPSMDLYLYQEFEYFTKPRVMADVSLQYTKKMKQNIAPYAKLSYNYTKAFDTQFLGGSFGVAGASVGCNF